MSVPLKNFSTVSLVIIIQDVNYKIQYKTYLDASKTKQSTETSLEIKKNQINSDFLSLIS